MTMPPSFVEARGRREKARAAGLAPDYWYPVAFDRDIRRGQVVEVKYWGRSIALFRGDDGVLAAVEDRCAHRQLPLSKGDVTGCRLTCMYHGWSYDGTGRLVDVPHSLFGRSMPTARVASYPVQVRYGLVWVFPGDPALVDAHPIPDIPELEGPDRWPVLPLHFLWRAHHSMIIENVSDFTHEWLHRKYRPFVGAKLTRCELAADDGSHDDVLGGDDGAPHHLAFPVAPGALLRHQVAERTVARVGQRPARCSSHFWMMSCCIRPTAGFSSGTGSRKWVSHACCSASTARPSWLRSGPMNAHFEIESSTRTTGRGRRTGVPGSRWASK